ncbi:MAG TPA: hypothetical protein VGK29_14155 [Paludibaculum sp.]|jgi:hypothetical protein
MKSRNLVAFLTLALCGTALAWQFNISTLGLTQKDIETRVAGALRDGSSELQAPWLMPAGRKAALALSEADRAAAVQTIGAAIKTFVTSEAFQKSHAESIRLSHKAVDHGIKVYSQEEALKMAMNPKPGVDPMGDMQKQLMAQGVMQLRAMPIESLKAMFDDSLKSWTRKAQTATNPKTKARAQKMAARAQEIQPWITSKPDEFKKAYSVLYSMDNDGPETDEELVKLANKGKLEEEQRAFNEHNWKPVLKKKLEVVVKEAASVDFAAQTTEAGGRRKFVNPAYERKSGIWKAMFRAGKAPTTAAVEFSKAWLKEL